MKILLLSILDLIFTSYFLDLLLSVSVTFHIYALYELNNIIKRKYLYSTVPTGFTIT